MKHLNEILKNHEVRLFSAVSITTEREAEMRATSALLSIIKAVSEYGQMFVKSANGCAGQIECYTEVELKFSGKRKVSRPDGVICVTRGKTSWKALLEVKVGKNGLDQEQFDRYHALAKEYAFDALITISNQAALPNGFPPLKVDLRRVKSTPVIHYSWERLLSEAQLLSWQCGVSDIDQRYMLNEWIRYVSDSNSRIVVAPTVGSYWNNLLSVAAADRLNTVQQDLNTFISTWSGFLRIEAYRLRALLGEQVEVRMTATEKKNSDNYQSRLLSETCNTNKLCSSLKIPHTAGDLDLTLDLRSRRIFFEVNVAPPSEKTTKGQIGWMVNQLKKLSDTPPELSLIVNWKKKALLSEVLVQGIADNRDALYMDMQNNPIPNDVIIRSFTIQWKTKLPRKKSDLFSTIGSNLEQFYQGVVEHLSVYVPPAPKLRKKEKRTNSVSEDQSSLSDSTALSVVPSKVDLPSWSE